LLRLAGLHALAQRSARYADRAGAARAVRPDAYSDGARELSPGARLGARGPLSAPVRYLVYAALVRLLRRGRGGVFVALLVSAARWEASALSPASHSRRQSTSVPL